MKIYKKILPAFLVEWKQPLGYNKEVSLKFSTGVHSSFPSVHIFIKNCVLISSEGVAFSTSEKLFRSTTRTIIPEINQGILLTWLRNRIRNISFCSNSLLLFDNWSGNYFHFWNDFMPRLFLTKDLFTEKSCTLLVDVSTLTIGMELFKQMGIARIKVVSKDELVFSNRIFYTNIITPNVGSFHADTLKALKEYIFQLMKIDYSTDNKRIYISRAKAAYRKVLNEDELLPILLQYGFEIVHAETLSMFDQIRLFKDASVILGLHGAGLSNMLFAKSTSLILELRYSGGVQNNLFYQLASCLEYSYSCFFSDVADGNDFQRANITVDTSLFSTFLQKNISILE